MLPDVSFSIGVAARLLGAAPASESPSQELLGAEGPMEVESATSDHSSPPASDSAPASAPASASALAQPLPKSVSSSSSGSSSTVTVLPPSTSSSMDNTASSSSLLSSPDSEEQKSQAEVTTTRSATPTPSTEPVLSGKYAMTDNSLLLHISIDHMVSIC